MFLLHLFLAKNIFFIIFIKPGSKFSGGKFVTFKQLLLLVNAQFFSPSLWSKTWGAEKFFIFSIFFGNLSFSNRMRPENVQKPISSGEKVIICHEQKPLTALSMKVTGALNFVCLTCRASSTIYLSSFWVRMQ